MTLTKAIETPEEKKLHRATDRALKKFRLAKQPAWDRLQKALPLAWRQYDRDIAPFEQACDREIAKASRAYTKATQNKGGAK